MFGSLLNREVNSVFSSVYSLIFAFVFFLINGLLLWLFSGSYNIFDNGYANLDRFFSLSSILFIFLIASLTMRSIGEEKMTKTLSLIYSRPVSVSAIYFSKLLSLFFYIAFVLLCSSVYLFCIYKLSIPVGNVDFQVIFSSYIGLMLVSLVFISWGVLASCLSKHSVVSFIIALFLNTLFFYGFDFISGLMTNGKITLFIQSLGILSHYSNFIRGTISLNDFLVFTNYICVAWAISIVILRPKIARTRKIALCIVIFILSINVINVFLPNKKYDFTLDRRYTLSKSAKEFLQSLRLETNQSLKINLYLSGDINYTFQRLVNATSDIVSDFNQYLKKPIEFEQIDTNTQLRSSSTDIASYMASRDMPPIVLNQKSRSGKISQQLIYPYAEIIYNQDTVRTLLLKNVPGFSAEEKINISIEDLETELIQNIRTLTTYEEKHIAFIEGHKELDRAYIYDAEEALAKYYFINRGEIGNEIGVLDQFRVVIIAGPKQKYTEAEKFILDQYIMQGGRILWLLDGVYLSEDDLKNKGQSASIKNETNLDDILFTYGIRVNSDLLEDAQCSQILLNNGEYSQTVNAPWYFAPILLPSTDNIITRSVGEIKSEFISSLDFIKTKDVVKKQVLLTSSDKTHIVNVPQTIDFDFNRIESQKTYFNESYITTAVSLEGIFSSAYLHRPIPDSIIDTNYTSLKQSEPTKMLVVSSSSIIRNEIVGKDADTQVLPLGYDKLSGRQYGNREFIVNAVNWLADTQNSTNLNVKTQTLRLLDKQKVSDRRDFYFYLNLLFPIFIICLVYILVILYRKFKYTR